LTTIFLIFDTTFVSKE